MVAALSAAALIFACSVVVGSAVVKASGRPGWTGLEGPLGLSALIAVDGLLIRAPGDVLTTCLATVALVVGAAVYASDRLLTRPETGVALAIATVLLATAIPFVVAGGFGVLGMGVNNDMASHLGWADTLRSSGLDQPLPVPAGYPVGPHALVATAAELLGTEVDSAFTGLLVAIPLLSVGAALSLLEGLSRARRALAAVLVAMPYLMAAYYGQAAFKETLQALLVLAFVGLLREAVRAKALGPRGLVPFAVILLGCLYNYSYLGLVWPVAILAVWLPLLAVGGAGRLDLRGALHRLRLKLPATAGGRAVGLAGVGALAAVLAPELARAVDFFEIIRLSPNQSGIIRAEILGNLAGHLSPFEALGIWPSEDFRQYFERPRSAYKAGLAGAVGATAAVAGGLWWIRRRDLVLPAAVIACGAIWAYLKQGESPYVTAKALAVMAPLTMAMALKPLLVDHRLESADLRVALAAFAALFASLALISSFLALRGSAVGPQERARELERLRPLVAGAHVLYLGGDEFIHWELRGAAVTDAFFRRRQEISERPAKRYVGGRPLDFDWLEPQSLDRVEYVLGSRTRYRSEPPANFRSVASTPSFELWRRMGSTPSRLVLDEGAAPGRVLDCRRRSDRRLSSSAGWARVMPRPVVASGGRGLRGLEPGRHVERALDIGPGRYELSLPYTAPRTVRVTAAGAGTGLPAELRRAGPAWKAATLRWPGGRLAVRLDTPPGRLGATNHDSYLGPLVAARLDVRRELVALRDACGRYVDWYTLGPTRPPLSSSG